MTMPSAGRISTAPRVTLRVIGWIAVAFAILGLAYNAFTLAGWRKLADVASLTGHELPYLYPAFFGMSAINVACHLALLWLGAQFLRLRTERRDAFGALLAFEVLYTLGIAMLPVALAFRATDVTSQAWAVTYSFAAAYGIANGGMVLPLYTLYFLWGPLAVRWAHRRIEREAPSAAPA